jgi:hypothetical protein
VTPEQPHRLRRNRDFMVLWSSQVVSTVGSRVSSIAYPLLVLALTHSPAKAGVVGFAQTLPFLRPHSRAHRAGQGTGRVPGADRRDVRVRRGGRPARLLRGAVGAARLATWGSIPLGTLAGGFLAAAFGARPRLLILTGIMGGVAAAATLAPGMRYGR